MLRLFTGGIHPKEEKHRTEGLALKQCPPPKEVMLPFSQHIGKPAIPHVKPGDRVLRGQRIADSAGFVSAAVHASVSGTVKAIVQVRHPLGFLVDAVKIENDGLDEWDPEVNAHRDCDVLSVKEIRDIVSGAGIVGMGGATFPSHVKLTPPEKNHVDTFILNGVECEPYLTADDRLMQESPDTVAKGALLFTRAVGAKMCIAGVEANKPEAARQLEEAFKRLKAPAKVVRLPVRYPQGAEKQLIYALLKREVPSGGLPADVGVVVHNVASAHAGYEACAFGKPLTERVVTVSGPGVNQPANFWTRIGTPAEHLLDACGFDRTKTKKLLVGGPMMGLPQRDLEWVVVKGTNGVLALDEAWDEPIRPCIRCGRCIEGCPASLLPCTLSTIGESGNLATSAGYNVMDCIECGVCSYVCPSRRPIVQWIRMEKIELARLRQMTAKV